MKLGHIRRGAILAIAVFGLSACSTSPNPSAEELTEVGFQLSWLHSVEWGSSYMAEANGHYADQHLAITLLPGGPSTASVPVVTSGKATVGVSTANAIAKAVSEGAPLTIVGAEFQRSPWGIISPESAPLSRPADIVGKRIGVSASSEPAWNAFLALNKIDPASITKVPLGFDLAPLLAGEVDGALGYDSEAPVTLAAKGFNAHSMPFADFGFNVVSHAYFVDKSTIQNKRDDIKRFLTAQTAGLKDYLQNSDTAANLAVSQYAADLGLDIEAQKKQGERQKALITTDETAANGLLYITPEMVEKNITSFEAMGISADVSLFDMTLLDEVYETDPEVRKND